MIIYFIINIMIFSLFCVDRYVITFLDVLVNMNSVEMETSLKERGVVFGLVMTPASVPVTLVFSYVIWLGLKVYRHTPPEI